MKRRKHTPATCSVCGSEIPEGREILVCDRGRRTTGTKVCHRCTDEMARILREESEDPDLLRAGLAGVAGALVSGLLWYWAAQSLRSGIPVMAVVVGVVVARAVMWGSGGKRGRRLQVLSATTTGLALLISTLVILRYFAGWVQVSQGAEGIPLLVPLDEVFAMFRAWVESDVTAVVFWALALWEGYHLPTARHLVLPESAESKA